MQEVVVLPQLSNLKSKKQIWHRKTWAQKWTPKNVQQLKRSKPPLKTKVHHNSQLSAKELSKLNREVIKRRDPSLSSSQP